jgi:hypothetical protein
VALSRQPNRSGLGDCRRQPGEDGQVGVQRNLLDAPDRSGDSAYSFLSRPFSRSTAPRCR